MNTKQDQENLQAVEELLNIALQINYNQYKVCLAKGMSEADYLAKTKTGMAIKWGLALSANEENAFACLEDIAEIYIMMMINEFRRVSRPPEPSPIPTETVEETAFPA